MKKSMVYNKTGNEPKWLRNCTGVYLVSSLKGRMIQCYRCKKKWFDFWYRVEWLDSTSEEMCLDCFETKVMGKKEKKPKKKVER